MYKKKKKEKKLYSQSCSDAGTQNSKFIPLLDGYGKLHSYTCSSPTYYYDSFRRVPRPNKDIVKKKKLDRIARYA